MGPHLIHTLQRRVAGPDNPGKGDAFAVYTFVNANDGTTSPVTSTSGGGGGWGAAGGSGTQTIDFATQKGGNLALPVERPSKQTAMR